MTLLRPRPCCWGQCCPSVPTIQRGVWEGHGGSGQEGPHLPRPQPWRRGLLAPTWAEWLLDIQEVILWSPLWAVRAWPSPGSWEAGERVLGELGEGQKQEGSSREAPGRAWRLGLGVGWGGFPTGVPLPPWRPG